MIVLNFVVIKIGIINFDKNDNAKWIAYTKIKNKIKRICTGIFNFNGDWCGILTSTPIFKSYADELFLELRLRDWDNFRISKCHKSIRDLVKQYKNDRSTSIGNKGAGKMDNACIQE